LGQFSKTLVELFGLDPNTFSFLDHFIEPFPDLSEEERNKKMEKLE